MARDLISSRAGKSRWLLYSLLIAFFYLSSLVVCLSSPAFPDVSPKPFGIRATEFSVPPPSNDDLIPLVRVYSRHLAKRDSQSKFLVEPRNEIRFDYLIGKSDLVHSFHWTHNELSYVNLEDLQTYSHISSSIPVCSQPDSNNNTVLDLRFTNYPAYVAAKRAWSGRDDLLMVIEDESCFEGKNLRSVYRAGDMTFVEQPGMLKAMINAQPKRFGPEETETASDVGIKFGSMRQLKNSYPEPFTLKSRRSSVDLPIISGRDNPLKDIMSEATEAFTSFASEATSAIKSVATSAAGEALKKLDSLEQGLGTEWSFNINMHHNIKDKSITAESGNETSNEAVETDEQRKNVMEGAQKIMPNLPSITFVDSHASMDLEFQFKFRTSIAKGIGKKTNIDVDGKDGGDMNLGKRDIEDWVQDASLTVVAVEAVDVRLQVETNFPAGATLFCSLYLWPIPGAFACAPLASVGPLSDALFSMPHTPQNPGGQEDKKNPGKQTMEKLTEKPNKYLEELPWKGPTKPSKDPNNKEKVRAGTMEGKNIHGFGFAFECGVGLWGSFTVKSDLNITWPGFHLKMDKGSTAGWGVKDGEEYHDKFDGSVEWLKPKFHTQNMHAIASLSFGPKMSFTVGGLAKRLAANFYARIDMPGVEFDLATKQGVDKSCKAGGPFADALALVIRIKTGLYAGVSLPGGLQVDTGMFNITGVPGMSGLMYVKDVFARCWDISNSSLGKWETGQYDQIEDDIAKDTNANLTTAKGDFGTFKPPKDFDESKVFGNDTSPSGKQDKSSTASFQPAKSKSATSSKGSSKSTSTASPSTFATSSQSTNGKSATGSKGSSKSTPTASRSAVTTEYYIASQGKTYSVGASTTSLVSK